MRHVFIVAVQYASLIGCRFMDATGNGWVSDAIRCFEYCISKDAQILSNSWGGVDYSKSLQVTPSPGQMPSYLHPCISTC